MNLQTKIISTSWGVFAVDPQHDVWFAHALSRHDWQASGVEAALQWINADSVVVDVGAHVGTFTVPFARKAAFVYAIEPTESSRKLLEENVERNGVTDKVSVLGVAASSAEGTFQKAVNLPPAETQYYESTEGIQGFPLDILVPRVDFLKIDVEGMELAVLTGARRLIETYQPVIFFEVNKKALDAHRVPRRVLGRYLRSRGYVFYRVEEGNLKKLFSLSQSVFMNVLALPRGVTTKATGRVPYLFSQVRRRLRI